jgi:hypothetical protein
MTKERSKEGRDRGKPAGFDPASGEVFGSGASAGGNEHSSEDYDSDLHGQDERAAKGGQKSR